MPSLPMLDERSNPTRHSDWFRRPETDRRHKVSLSPQRGRTHGTSFILSQSSSRPFRRTNWLWRTSRASERPRSVCLRREVAAPPRVLSQMGGSVTWPFERTKGTSKSLLVNLVGRKQTLIVVEAANDSHAVQARTSDDASTARRPPAAINSVGWPFGHSEDEDNELGRGMKGWPEHFFLWKVKILTDSSDVIRTGYDLYVESLRTQTTLLSTVRT